MVEDALVGMLLATNDKGSDVWILLHDILLQRGMVIRCSSMHK